MVFASPLSLFFSFLLLLLRRGSGRFLFVGNIHSLPTRAHSEHAGLPISPNWHQRSIWVTYCSCQGAQSSCRDEPEQRRIVHFVFFLGTPRVSIQLQSTWLGSLSPLAFLAGTARPHRTLDRALHRRLCWWYGRVYAMLPSKGSTSAGNKLNASHVIRGSTCAGVWRVD